MPGTKFTILYHEDVIKKDIPSLSITIKNRIKTVIEEKLIHQPEIFGKPLRTSLKGYRKLRVNSYRIIFRIENKNIIIFKIGHRKDIYKNLQRFFN